MSPARCVFSYATIGLARESQRLGVRHGRRTHGTNLMLARQLYDTPEVRTEYHSSLVLSYLFWRVWHLRSCSRPAGKMVASGLKIETAAEGPIRAVSGPGLLPPPSAEFRLDPGRFVIIPTVSGACPLAIFQPHFP